MTTFLYTAIALLAFSGNSILCRIALADKTIDGISFTCIRLISGALTLALITTLLELITKGRNSAAPHEPLKNNLIAKTSGSWISAFSLFIYALLFSIAYLTLDTGTGALILFACVQITIISVRVINKKTLNKTEWTGTFIALAGFIYLVAPTVNTPSLLGFSLMVIAGVAWGVYTLTGQTSLNPLRDTTANFLRTVPLVILLLAGSVPLSQYSSVFSFIITQKGCILAIASGALASGAGYAVWYKAMRGLNSLQSGVVQLFVPSLAALGGFVFYNEPLTHRLLIASVIILGGMALVILAKSHAAEP